LRIAPTSSGRSRGRLLGARGDRRHMITTHVLDTARGGPAVGITNELRHHSEWS
jgi:hypothetical protein